MGLEQAYNDILSGTDGRVYFEKDIYGNALPGTVAEEKSSGWSRYLHNAR